MGTRWVSRAVTAAMTGGTHSAAVKRATAVQSSPSGPAIRAANVTANPATAKPICVPIATPDSRTLVGNISP